MPQAERITREPREAEEPQQGKWILPDHLMSLNILDVCRYMEEKKKKSLLINKWSTNMILKTMPWRKVFGGWERMWHKRTECLASLERSKWIITKTGKERNSRSIWVKWVSEVPQSCPTLRVTHSNSPTQSALLPEAGSTRVGRCWFQDRIMLSSLP